MNGGLDLTKKQEESKEKQDGSWKDARSREGYMVGRDMGEAALNWQDEAS